MNDQYQKQYSNREKLAYYLKKLNYAAARIRELSAALANELDGTVIEERQDWTERITKELANKKQIK